METEDFLCPSSAFIAGFVSPMFREDVHIFSRLEFQVVAFFSVLCFWFVHEWVCWLTKCMVCVRADTEHVTGRGCGPGSAMSLGS